MERVCGGLNESDPHRLIVVNIWWNCFGKDWGVWLVGRGVLLRVGCEALENLSHFKCVLLCLLLVQYVSSQLFCHYAFILPSWMLNLWNQ